jgi:hypothetical protein
MPHINYGGIRYPVTTKTLRNVIEKIGSFKSLTHTDLFEITTTDGRYVVLNLGPSLPIAFEGEAKTDLEGE